MRREDVERFDRARENLERRYGHEAPGLTNINRTVLEEGSVKEEVRVALFANTPLNAYELNILGTLYCEELISFEDLVFIKDSSSKGRETASIKFLQKKGYIKPVSIDTRTYYILSEDGKAVVERLIEKRKAAKQSP